MFSKFLGLEQLTESINFMPFFTNKKNDEGLIF